MPFSCISPQRWGSALYSIGSTADFPPKEKRWDTVITTLIIFLLLHYGDNLLYPLLATFLPSPLNFLLNGKTLQWSTPRQGLCFTAGVLALIPGIDQPFISWWGTTFWALPWGVSVSFLLMALWILGDFTSGGNGQSSQGS